MLYVIPTPIWNTNDITLNALNLFKDLNYFICEDTRTFKKLLKIYNIDYQSKKFFSLTSYTKKCQIWYFLNLIETENVWLVSEAWTPWFSDPWKILILECISKNLKYTVLPWANALIPAIVASWFPTQNFIFWGFLPNKKWKLTILKKIINSEIPCFFYESVHRINKTLQTLIDLWFDWQIFIWREISKIYEQFITWNIKEIINKINNWQIQIKWEFVVWVYNK